MPTSPGFTRYRMTNVFAAFLRFQAQAGRLHRPGEYNAPNEPTREPTHLPNLLKTR